MKELKVAAAFIVLISFLSVSGCATVKEGAKQVIGISTKELENSRKDAIVRDMRYDYFSAYTKTLDILKGLNFYIYEQNIKKHMIAIYISQADTTPVGMFFKELDADKTRIEFASPSTYAKEYVAAKVSSAFEEMNKPPKKGE